MPAGHKLMPTEERYETLNLLQKSMYIEFYSGFNIQTVHIADMFFRHRHPRINMERCYVLCWFVTLFLLNNNNITSVFHQILSPL